MKKLLASLAAALGLAFLFAGCETDGRTARIQEKSATFAALTPEQKKVISDGAFEIGYTADMVYMAIGFPKAVKSKDAPEGKVEMWTYTNYYPTVAATSISMNPAGSRYTPMQTNYNAPGGGMGPKATQPAGFSGSSGGPSPGLDVADIPSHTLYVFFLNGKVIDIKLDNAN